MKYSDILSASGFGMRVVGGKKDVNGTLGAYVTMVTIEGPASTQGIQIGMLLMKWYRKYALSLFSLNVNLY